MYKNHHKITMRLLQLEHEHIERHLDFSEPNTSESLKEFHEFSAIARYFVHSRYTIFEIFSELPLEPPQTLNCVQQGSAITLLKNTLRGYLYYRNAKKDVKPDSVNPGLDKIPMKIREAIKHFMLSLHSQEHHFFNENWLSSFFVRIFHTFKII